MKHGRGAHWQIPAGAPHVVVRSPRAVHAGSNPVTSPACPPVRATSAGRGTTHAGGGDVAHHPHGSGRLGDRGGRVALSNGVADLRLNDSQTRFGGDKGLLIRELTTGSLSRGLLVVQ